MKILTLIEIAERAKKRFDAQEKQELKQRIREVGMLCNYCEKEKPLIEFEELDFHGFCKLEDVKGINLHYRKEWVFIDRGYLRKADPTDSECLDHSEKIKINFCPICGKDLRQKQELEKRIKILGGV